MDAFPQIVEFGSVKVNTIQLASFEVSRCDDLRIFFISEGKFEWVIHQQQYILYPGDVVLVWPGQEVGGSKGFLEIGTFYSLQIQIAKVWESGKFHLGHWSGLTSGECRAIEKVLMINGFSVLKAIELGVLFQEIQFEMQHQEIGYVTRIHHLLDFLFITLARQCTRQSTSRRDFPQAFMKLEQALRRNLSHQWTVEEMAAMVGLGTTAFTEKVKNFTGFPPLHYLINIRIAEATKQLKQPEVNITEIALGTGFYSSQHFSTTFKKLTGHTPSEFRKRNLSQD